MEWQIAFEFSYPLAEVWAAFYDTEEPQVWNNPLKGDAYIAQGLIDIEIVDFEPPTLVRFTEAEGDDQITMVVAIEETETGIRPTVTRSGFGSGDDWVDMNTVRLQGWQDALHDLGVYLESGVVLRRIHEWKGAFAATLTEVPGGLLARSVAEDGFAAQAGMQAGDLVTRMAGVAVFRRSDQWISQRMFKPGDDVSIDHIRDGEVLSGHAPMSPLQMWSGG
jgi:hypothetical protein